MLERIRLFFKSKEIVPTVFDETLRYVVSALLGTLGISLLANVSIAGAWLGSDISMTLAWLIGGGLVLLATGMFIGRATLRQRLRQLSEIASRDILTGLLNQREFVERLPREIARSKRYKHELSVILLDIDSFKQINDTYSYVAGDEILKQFANYLSGGVRMSDLVFRYKQGDEFVLLLPGTPLEGARHLAEKLRSRLADYNFQVRVDRPKERIAISAGVVALSDKDDTAQVLIGRVEEALSKAKATKNVVITL